MRQVGKFKLYSSEEVKTRLFGPVGTPDRDAHEQRVSEAVHAYQIGEAIKEARIQQRLTQEQLGARIGVQKSQISRLERGGNVSLSSISRVFRALNIPLALEVGNTRRVALW